MDLVPVRTREHEVEASGLVTILEPRFHNRVLKRLFAARIARSPLVRMRLDELGTATWLAIDGTRTVAEVADQVRAACGERCEPVYTRVALFIGQLARNRFVRLEERRGGER
jgi:hypothetical protein